MLGRTQLIAGAVALAMAFGAGWASNGWRKDVQIAQARQDKAELLEQLAQGTAAAALAARAEEARRTAAVEEQRDIAQQQAQALAVDVAAAADTAGRLRGELDALRRRGAACSAAAAVGGEGQPGADPIGLLIDVLEGVEAAGREVAEYADRLMIAGAACEATYDEMRHTTSDAAVD